MSGISSPASSVGGRKLGHVTDLDIAFKGEQGSILNVVPLLPPFLSSHSGSCQRKLLHVTLNGPWVANLYPRKVDLLLGNSPELFKAKNGEQVRD